MPLYIAEQEGFYADSGVQVELVPFLSALIAGSIDAAISDPVGALLLDKGRGLLKMTTLCLGAKPGEGMFAILASPRSGLQAVEELKGVQVAVSTATIIEYVTGCRLFSSVSGARLH